MNTANLNLTPEGRNADGTAPALTIEVFFDFVCPWCLIGKRHLRTAIDRLAQMRPDVRVRVQWRSHQLLPDIPPGGVPYQSFYVARLGSPEAVARRRLQVQQAAAPAGIDFAFERIDIMPNTAAAHNLVSWVGEHGAEAQQAALIESLFTAYFIEGEDIGALSVLQRRALGCGVELGGLLEHLVSDSSGKNGVMHQPPQTDYGVSGVPFFVFNGTHAISGAYPPDALLEIMLQLSQG